MGPEGITQIIHMPNGQEISINTGRYAKQADGSALLRCGDTVLLATVCSATEVAPETDFFPLSVDYREKYYATGKFPGGFFKREAKPSDYEVLISRLIDRALRPLFPDDYHAETIVQVNLLSAEKGVAPDALAALAASAAISVSDIPFHGPISEVRVALIGDEYVINPSFEQQEEARLELMVAASMKDICMVEGECKEVSEEEMLGALKAAHEAIKIQCQAQIELMEKVNKAKREYCHEVNDETVRQEVQDNCYQACYDFALSGCADKHLREDTFNGILDKYLEKYTEEELETVAPLAKRYFHDVQRSAVRNAVLDKRIRLDGRQLNQVRPIWTEVDILPSAHGSAVFTRGETQALVTVTLGTKLDEQTIDGAVVEGTKNFTLHYNFPGFATGEAKAARSTSRREIGHGNLAERALKTMVPHDESMPYTVRIVSDILESNGSSSMASVCGGCLALMDAGVPMRKPVAGVAMGMISDSETGKYAILTDILGDEDHLGDMDFKVTGTRDGITACQMDIKVDGLSYEVLTEALEQARQGRLHILDEMAKTISEPRADYKEIVPRIEKMYIPKDFIGAVIGPGGKVIQEMQKVTNTIITITEDEEKGIVEIASQNKADIEACKAKIRAIVAVPEVGEVYHGKVVSIMAFGAFVEILPNKDGLLHISEIGWERYNTMEETGLKEGDEIDVKLIEIDSKTGKLRLSRRELLPKPEGYVEKKGNGPRPGGNGPRPNGGNKNGGGHSNGGHGHGGNRNNHKN
ncbi:MAG: polyribonucleotide nucleotidyltransferase [Bacteroidales bacterium]|nr:polyribonucleotide nucleotidyltransferase [Bacteroidales bacterium]